MVAEENQPRKHLGHPTATMGKFVPCSPSLCFLLLVLAAGPFPSSGTSPDNIDSRGTLRDGETLVSAGGGFELGFFSPGASTKKFLCIRCTKGQERPIVWVANREHPLNDSTGVLKFGEDGNLVVALGGSGGVVWSTKLSPNASADVRVARLLDSGNLVVGEAGDDLPSGGLWQSFDEPGDTMLPGMSLWVNKRTGATRRLRSWKSTDDPSPGNYSYGVEFDNLPRLLLRDASNTITYSAGFWNGIRFTGIPPMNANGFYNTTVVSSGDVVSYTDWTINSSRFIRGRLDPSGRMDRFVWRPETGAWSSLWTVPGTCDLFAACGSFATCAVNRFPRCRCLRGFHPRSSQEWDEGNGTGGCARTTRPNCGGGDDFLPVVGVKLPEIDNSSTVNMDLSLDECKEKCARDCSCTGYALADVREGGKGCITWSGGLVDVRDFTVNIQDFYLRVAASDVDSAASDDRRRKSKRPAVVAASVCAVLGTLFLALCGFWVRKKWSNKTKDGKREVHDNKMIDGEHMELPLFDFKTIALATNSFSIGNKVGEGGFGTVFKGVLEGGQEIAVKRLSLASVQGVGEFMNEVKLIAKLQHNNLVRLLGCCIEGAERLLIFEYMQNKSLDSFIFDEVKRAQLGWRLRLDIILGVARGLLYLHHDSRLKIIHRDLKAGNILLDGAMNPKITDFGTARIFEANQHIESTKRVIGTYGYMSPEYALNGIISVKSDVFSFGVLVLEILSGLRSRGIYETEPHVNLLSHAWNLWQDGNYMAILDPTVESSYHQTELWRCIQVGLLCVQEHARDRPTMNIVLMMLGNENVPLPRPKKPGFLLFRSPHRTEATSSSKQEPSATNDITVTTLLEGR